MGPASDSGGVGKRSAGRPPATVLTAAGWLVGIVVTSLILGTPYLVFGYHSPDLHLVLDSVDGSVALLVAYLLYGRFVRSRRLQDLLLAQGLLQLAVAGFALTLLLDRFETLRPRTLDVWLPLAIRVLGALLIAAAALAGGRPGRSRVGWWARLVPWAVVVVVSVALWLARDQLPAALGETPPDSAQHPVITGHPVLLAAQGVAAVSFVVASLAFTVQAGRRHDELFRWLGPGFALAAFARLNYLLFPSLYSGWFYTGDILRTGCYLLLLVGAAREISRYWSAQARVAVLEDRRRLARELHDGVLQELGYIRAEAHSAPVDEGVTGRIVASCDRAIDEARAAVDALGRTTAESLGFMLHGAARQVAERYGGSLEVEVDDSVLADADQRHALLRITREAVSNALRHGQAKHVSIRLVGGPEVRELVVRDDGCGFDVDVVRGRSTGYGLTSMRERAQALPGSFTIESAPGKGSVVTVAW